MSDKAQSVQVSLPIAGLLGVVFIALKLMGYIAWPWIWVLAPFWVPIALVLGLMAIAFVVILLIEAVKSFR